jgi:hypothetical protein
MPTTVAIRKGRLLHLLEDLDVPEQELLKLNVEVIAQGEDEIYSPVSVHHDYYVYIKPPSNGKVCYLSETFPPQGRARADLVDELRGRGRFGSVEPPALL